MEKPYLILNCQDNGTVTTRGTPHCLLGHQIKHTPGRKPDGVYVEWSWDGQKLVVENDCFGMYPLYYYHQGQEIGISPSIVRLLAEGANRDLDYGALSVFLRLGFFVGQDTAFRSIRALPPNATFLWQNGQLKVSGQLNSGRPQPDLSYDQVMDRFLDLFRQSIRRRLPKGGRWTVPLSGGRDSRLILFALKEQGQTPEFCLTSTLFPPHHQEDIQIAKIVTQRLNIRHEILEQDSTLFQAEIRRNLVTGFCSDEVQESLACTDYFRDHQIETIYDGLIGITFIAGFFINEKKQGLLEKGKIRELADEILKGWGHVCLQDEVFPLIFHEDISRQMTRELALDRVEANLRPFLNTPNPIMECMLRSRTRREMSLSPYAIHWEVPTVFSPYIDTDLYEFFSGIPAKYFIDRKFNDRTIQRGYPQYSDIPFEHHNAKGVDPTSFRQHFVRDLLFYLMKERGSADSHMRLAYIVPRLMRYLVKADNWWLCPNLILYMTQLEKIRTSPSRELQQWAKMS